MRQFLPIIRTKWSVSMPCAESPTWLLTTFLVAIEPECLLQSAVLFIFYILYYGQHSVQGWTEWNTASILRYPIPSVTILLEYCTGASYIIPFLLRVETEVLFRPIVWEAWQATAEKLQSVKSCEGPLGFFYKIGALQKINLEEYAHACEVVWWELWTGVFKQTVEGIWDGKIKKEAEQVQN